MGGETLISAFRRRIETTIEEKFLHFKDENEQKRVDYIVSVGSQERKIFFIFRKILKLYIISCAIKRIAMANDHK